MTHMKNTKRALFASVVSLLLCISMLIGSTFAWFTDTATTGVNTITAGNLDIKVSYKNATVTEWKEVSETEKLFNDAALWEPGYTEVAYLKVENNGSLALKYQLAINVTGEVIGKNKDGGNITLSEVLKYDLIELTADTTYADRAAALAAVSDAKNLASETVSGTIEAKADAKYFALVVYMPANVGNEGNHDGTNIPSIELGVNVYATQLMSEDDSFGNDYDEDALYPNQIPVASQAELNDAITAAGSAPVEFFLADGTYSFTEVVITNKNITFTGTKNAVFDMSAQQGVNMVPDMVGTTLTFNGVTVKWSDANEGYQGIKNPHKVVYKDCTIIGTQFMYSGADFIGCTFETGNGYAVYTRAPGKYTFTGCTFTTGGRAIMMYNDAVIEASVTLNNCTFSDDGTYTSKDKAVVETGDFGGACKYNIEINNCTITQGFETNNSTSALWGNKDNMSTDRLNVVINGADVY